MRDAVATVVQPMTPTAIALNRFGLGARPDEPLPASPADWLRQQTELRPVDALPTAWADQPATVDLASRMIDRQQALRDASDADRPTVRKTYNREMQQVYRQAADARLVGALNAPAPFIERLVYFWANHFAVSIEKQPVALFAGSFEAEAIRPHVLGHFNDMLRAVEQHPAMQFFLDQTRSIGPDSLAAERVEAQHPERKLGLNENLARETMELHTLGARSGYDQRDVTEFARALTGWSIAGNRDIANGRNDVLPGAFVFRSKQHEPGPRTIMGRTYAASGVQQGLDALHDFSTSSATAHHVADKLARHFVSDTPPPALVARLADAFTNSEGHLPTVYRVLIDSSEAWQPVNAKFKTPWDWAVSSMRGLGWRDLGKFQAVALLNQLGQPIWRPGSPAGYDDIAASWAAPDALVRRVEIAQRFAAHVGDKTDARTLAPQLLPGALSAATATEVAHAESAPVALALLLVSPDFLRR